MDESVYRRIIDKIIFDSKIILFEYDEIIIFSIFLRK